MTLLCRGLCDLRQLVSHLWSTLSWFDIWGGLYIWWWKSVGYSGPKLRHWWICSIESLKGGTEPRAISWRALNAMLRKLAFTQKKVGVPGRVYAGKLCIGEVTVPTVHDGLMGMRSRDRGHFRKQWLSSGQRWEPVRVMGMGMERKSQIPECWWGSPPLWTPHPQHTRCLLEKTGTFESCLHHFYPGRSSNLSKS